MALNVSESTFEQEVLKKSAELPVLVDFWAEWCGPCRVIGPMLERLEHEYTGRFVLAKINTDEEQGLAGAFQITGIPAVKLFSNGKLKDEFVGALPDKQIRAFLDRNIPDPRFAALARLDGSDPALALAQAKELGAPMESTDAILWDAAKSRIRTHGPDALVVEILEAIREFGGPICDARRAVLLYLPQIEADAERDALRHVTQGETEQRNALDFFIDKVAQSAGAAKVRYKNGALACFHLLGNKGPLVDEYGRRLSATLN